MVQPDPLGPQRVGPGRSASSAPCATKKNRARRTLTMSGFYNIMLGDFFGFALGVGCALAVFYAIYSGGYRKAIEHSLLQQKPKRYQEAMAAVVRQIGR